MNGLASNTSLFLDSSLSGFAGFAEVADEATTAPGEFREVEDCGRRGSCEGQWGFAWINPPASKLSGVGHDFEGVG